MPAYTTHRAGDDSDRVLDVPAVARILGRSEQTIRRYFRQGLIPGAKHLAGGRWIILESDLDAYLRHER